MTAPARGRFGVAVSDRHSMNAAREVGHFPRVTAGARGQIPWRPSHLVRTRAAVTPATGPVARAGAQPSVGARLQAACRFGMAARAAHRCQTRGVRDLARIRVTRHARESRMNRAPELRRVHMSGAARGSSQPRGRMAGEAGLVVRSPAKRRRSRCGQRDSDQRCHIYVATRRQRCPEHTASQSLEDQVYESQGVGRQVCFRSAAQDHCSQEISGGSLDHIQALPLPAGASTCHRGRRKSG